MRPPTSWARSLLQAVNFLGNTLPKGLQRRVSDSPGMLTLLQRIGGNRSAHAASPEGATLVYNPLFHAYLFRDGGLNTYEPELRHALDSAVRPGMVAYDIGANVGTFTLQLANLVGPAGHVFAFEADPFNYRFLRDTIDANCLSHVTAMNCAISAATGTADFDRRGGAFSGRLVGGNTSYARTRNTLTVDTASIDDLIRDGRIKAPKVVKIDVEGTEALVLRGMRGALAASRPVVACEIHTYLGDSAADVETELRRARYGWQELGTRRRERQILARPLPIP